MRLISTLIQHHWKAFFRSPTWQRELGVYVLLGLFLLYLAAAFLGIGIFVEEFLAGAFPGIDPVLAFHRSLLYYLVVDLVARFVLQGAPILRTGPYLHLPIKKTSLIHLILTQVPFTWFNFFPCLIAIPFAVQLLVPPYGVVASVVWFVAVLAILVGNAYLIFYVRRKMSVHSYWLGLLLGLLIVMVLADYYAWFPVSIRFAAAFDALLTAPYWVLVPLCWWAGMYYLNFRSLRGLYAEGAASSQPRIAHHIGSFSFLQRYGIEGALMTNEIKLILRHKRTRAAMIIILVFFLYAITFYQEDRDAMSPMLVFLGVYLTGGLMMNYGQFLISWEGNHLDGLLVNRIPFSSFLNSKYRLLLLLSLIGLLLSLPFAMFGWEVLVINIICWLFNAGVTTWLLLFFATYNRRSVDLDHNHWMNFQGISNTQFVLTLIVLLIPWSLYAIPYYAGYSWLGIAVLAVTGSVGWIMRGYWLQRTTRKFRQAKYAMAEGFRNTE